MISPNEKMILENYLSWKEVLGEKYLQKGTWYERGIQCYTWGEKGENKSKHTLWNRRIKYKKNFKFNSPRWLVLYSFSPTQLQDKALLVGVTVVRVVIFETGSLILVFTNWIIYFLVKVLRLSTDFFSWLLNCRFLECSHTCSGCRICTADERSWLKAIYSSVF